jgi:CO dehydrogenase maturation factor
VNKIAVCGKGGSGKSVLVRLLAEGLQSRGRRAVVVDADESNTGLHRMLGFDEPPAALIDLLGGKPQLESQLEEAVRAGIPEMKVELIHQEMQLADLPPEYMFVTDGGVRLVNVGKILMALEGCACPMGIVSRSFLKMLRLEPDEVAVVDLEAGVEHFGRGVETSLDCVLVVVEPSIDSLEVAAKISELSAQIEIADVFVVLNKIASEDIAERLRDRLSALDMTVIGTIHQNQEIFESGLDGRPIRAGAASEDIEGVLDFLFP